jgi:hypothetical protein
LEDNQLDFARFHALILLSVVEDISESIWSNQIETSETIPK